MNWLHAFNLQAISYQMEETPSIHLASQSCITATELREEMKDLWEK